MMSRQKAARVFSELNRRTQEGKLKWEQLPRGEVSAFSGDTLIAAFVTNYNTWRLGLLRMGIRQYDPERETNFTTEQTVLTILSKMDRVEFEFPDAPGLSDLLQSVTYATSNAEDFVAELLGDKEGD